MFQPDPAMHRLLSVERAERLRADAAVHPPRRRGALRRRLSSFEPLKTRQSTASGGT
jgi:hypothetical protein